MQDYSELVAALRCRATHDWTNCGNCKYADEDDYPRGCWGTKICADAADAIEALQAEVKRLQDKLCDWCAVCPKERRNPEDCEMLSETPVMYGPSCEKLEVQE